MDRAGTVRIRIWKRLCRPVSFARNRDVTERVESQSDGWLDEAGSPHALAVG